MSDSLQSHSPQNKTSLNETVASDDMLIIITGSLNDKYHVLRAMLHPQWTNAIIS